MKYFTIVRNIVEEIVMNADNLECVHVRCMCTHPLYLNSVISGRYIQLYTFQFDTSLKVASIYSS